MKKISVSLLTVLFLQLLLFPISSFAQSLIAKDFTKSTPKDTTLSFSANDFISNSTPPSGKSLVSVKFNQVPNTVSGNLKLKGNVVSKGSTISTGDLNSLTFVPSAGYEGEAIITWTANYGGSSSPYPGAIVITIGSGVLTPSVIPDNDKPSTEEVKTPETKPEGTKNETAQKNEEAKKETTTSPEKAKEKVNLESKKSTVQKQKTNYKSYDHEQGLKPLRYEDMLTHWGAYSAGMLASRGYVIGEDYGNNFYFRPDEKITRLDFILMVNAIFGIEPKDSLSDNPFSDKNVPDYILKAGSAAYHYDVIEGLKGKDGKLYLNPYSTVSRAEAITIVDYALRLDSYGVDEAEFKDVNQIPDWAMQSVKNLEAYGIIQGYEDNTIRPNQTLTRAQAAEMVWQALKFLDLKRNSSAVFSTIIYGD